MGWLEARLRDQSRKIRLLGVSAVVAACATSSPKHFSEPKPTQFAAIFPSEQMLEERNFFPESAISFFFDAPSLVPTPPPSPAVYLSWDARLRNALPHLIT